MGFDGNLKQLAQERFRRPLYSKWQMENVWKAAETYENAYGEYLLKLRANQYLKRGNPKSNFRG